jgi:hypothetical protein
VGVGEFDGDGSHGRGGRPDASEGGGGADDRRF